MKYIGNKTRLLDFIDKSMQDAGVVQSGVFADLFSGTASVGKYFKQKGLQVVSNDLMTYSYFAQYVLIKLNRLPSFAKISQSGLDGALEELNSLSPKKGYVFENYAPSGKAHRQYFSDNNAQKIDAIRDKIQKWYNEDLINMDEHAVLVYALIDAADFVANISGTYGAYLKIWRSMALKPLTLKRPDIISNDRANQIYQENANLLARKIQADIVYLDPPYNARQYAPNFHVLESLAVWDKQELYGKTGQRDYSDKKSLYCQKTTAESAFADLIKNIQSKYIVLSYNNEGIIPREKIINILKTRGKVQEFTTDYRRFRTEKDHAHRHYKKCDDKVLEHLFVVEIA